MPDTKRPTQTTRIDLLAEAAQRERFAKFADDRRKKDRLLAEAAELRRRADEAD